jgi:hypothetical protein
MADDFNWQCPYCAHDVTITSTRLHVEDVHSDVESADGTLAIETVFITCPNRVCRRTSVQVQLYEWKWAPSGPIRPSGHASGETDRNTATELGDAIRSLLRRSTRATGAASLQRPCTAAWSVACRSGAVNHNIPQKRGGDPNVVATASPRPCQTLRLQCLVCAGARARCGVRHHSRFEID